MVNFIKDPVRFFWTMGSNQILLNPSDKLILEHALDKLE
jgi:hypothetical protein